MLKFENKEYEQSITDSSNEAQNCPNFELSEIDNEIILDNDKLRNFDNLEVI